MSSADETRAGSDCHDNLGQQQHVVASGIGEMKTPRVTMAMEIGSTFRDPSRSSSPPPKKWQIANT
jgi:hypothetical protein